MEKKWRSRSAKIAPTQAKRAKGEKHGVATRKDYGNMGLNNGRSLEEICLVFIVGLTIVTAEFLSTTSKNGAISNEGSGLRGLFISMTKKVTLVLS